MIKYILILLLWTMGGDAVAGIHSHIRHPIKKVDVASGVAASSYIILNVNSGKTLINKNEFEQRSIASITKLFLATVIMNANQNLNEYLYVGQRYGLKSRLPINKSYTREQLLRLSLMSSDNLATKVLAINYPGGEQAAIIAMNAYVRGNHLFNTTFDEVTGLSENNKSTASDVARFLSVAESIPGLTAFTSHPEDILEVDGRLIKYKNTNPLVKENRNIIISKTGFTNPAGRCLAMFITTATATYAVVLLHEANKPRLIRDALLMIEKIEALA